MAYGEKQKEYTIKYLAKLKEIRFRVSPEKYAEMEMAAKKRGGICEHEAILFGRNK